MITTVFGADAYSLGFMRWYLRWPPINSASDVLELRQAFASVGASVPEDCQDYAQQDEEGIAVAARDIENNSRRARVRSAESRWSTA